jgi:superfamily II DNA/RNA helicase
VPITFAKFGVAPELVAALAKRGIDEPTAIQQMALPGVAGRPGRSI